ncbi:Peptidyl-prolyl isomerase cwc27 [Didymosphaeria variabile]|uniref:peptidylprolyl isomerase n=1 Tax=Didymosphaeria variabile TaxID=1932322 RepID=A0A9W9CBY0_9PLEO|nr:Peptidyl-prolyl isomerase cwc27 [Didymosphaeria variabile]KAJ4353918.1 Peptidyl-prolyl isomerase cwc27 [Didymosphaeria variabile]
MASEIRRAPFQFQAVACRKTSRAQAHANLSFAEESVAGVMASTYNLEPHPTAKVVLHTTTGDLELELFAKQTPVTSRNFLQLCLDGYYDNTVFHRLVKDFIIQGGDPTGTGHGGESSYDGEPFADEFHSRLKFNRRGLLGMANTGKKDDNGSQFFFTLANTPELQGQNTMFGRVAGDTIYNLMKMAESEIAEGSEDRPMYPTRITSAEIIINPFDDMVKKVQVAQRTEPDAKKPKKTKRKAGKNLMSFGGDEGEEADSAPVAKKTKYNTKLVSAGAQIPSALDDTPMPKAHKEEKSIPIRKPRKSPSRSPSPKPAFKPAHASHHRREEPSPPPEELSSEADKQSKLDRVNAQIAELKASMKRNTGAQRAEPTKKKSLLESMVPTSTAKGRKRGAASSAASEKTTLDILSKFKSKLESAAPVDAKMKTPEIPEANAESAPVANGSKAADEEEVPCDLHFVVGCQSCTAWDKQGEEESDDDTGWMNHSLSFAKDRLGKDLEWKRKNEEELLVIDPLEKAKEFKVDRKGKRDWDDGKGKRKMKI